MFPESCFMQVISLVLLVGYYSLGYWWCAFLTQIAMNELLLSGQQLPQVPQQKHSKEAQCYICGHKFRWEWLLRRHMRTHTGEKPFSCPYCPYRANRKEMIRSHIFHRHQKLQALQGQQQWASLVVVAVISMTVLLLSQPKFSNFSVCSQESTRFFWMRKINPFLISIS